MSFRREDAPPYVHHTELVSSLAVDIRRQLDRLGMMRGLTTVRVAANGCYRIDVTPASAVRLDTLLDLGTSIADAMELLDEVQNYDPNVEAAVLVMENNPIDGTLLTFMLQGLASVR